MNQSRRWKRRAIPLLVAASLCLLSRDASPQSSKSRQAARNSAAKSKKAESQNARPEVALDPIIFLIRDPLVQAELRLSAAQQAGVDDLAASVNEPVWKLRDLAPEAGSEDILRLNEIIEAGLAKLLSAKQHERAAQIILRLQGPAAIARPKVVEQLELAPDQKATIAAICANARAALQDLRTQASAGKHRTELARKVENLRDDLQKNLLAALTPSQRDRWAVLLGKPFDVSKLQPLTAQAPELRDVEAWINTEPLTLGKLRGKVVALHFWTFG
jgi:hypothetical protein